MAIEKLLTSPTNVGRKLISYAATDPFGESCLITGGYLIKIGSLEIALPLTAVGIWHTRRIYLNRIRMSKALNELQKRKQELQNEIKEEKEKILNKFNSASWCSHQMARAYLWGNRQYSEFKHIIKKHPFYYYFLKELKTIKQKIK